MTATNRIVLHFIDGQRGDADGVANGEIRDPGGPGRAGAAGLEVNAPALSVAEGGASAQFDVSLISRPVFPVTVTVTTDGQTNVAPEQLVFDAQNWAVSQPITISAVDDSLLENLHTSTLSYSVSSADPFYDQIAVAPTQVTVTDNDTGSSIYLPVVGGFAVQETGTNASTSPLEYYIPLISTGN